MATALQAIRLRISSMLRGDKLIWFSIAMLATFSILTVYSSAEALAHNSGYSSGTLLAKHIVLLLGAIGMIFICHAINYMRYARMSTWMLLTAIFMLLATLLIGKTVNGATRWLEIPILGMSFQTSDFAKIALITYTARTISLGKYSDGELIFPILLVCGLIAPVDLSTALVLFLTCMMLMFIGQVSLRNILTLLMLGIGLFAVLIALSEYFDIIRVDTWKSRLWDFLGFGSDGNELPEGQDVYQIQQAKIAIAQGGFFGTGPGNGVQAHFLPHAYSDYIYCIIIEEYGMLGAFLVIVLYMTLLMRCIRLVTRTNNAFGAMLAAGLSLGLIVQAFAHIAVNVNLVPVTGLTLPMVSMGGTSLIFTGISLGIILSVSRFVEAADAGGNPVEEDIS